MKITEITSEANRLDVLDLISQYDFTEIANGEYNVNYGGKLITVFIQQKPIENQNSTPINPVPLTDGTSNPTNPSNSSAGNPVPNAQSEEHDMEKPCEAGITCVVMGGELQFPLSKMKCAICEGFFHMECFNCNPAFDHSYCFRCYHFLNLESTVDH